MVYISDMLYHFQLRMAQTVFGVWDYIIMAATMVASTAIGIYFRFSGGKQKTNEVCHNELLIQISIITSKFKNISLIFI